ncbi:FecR family protein [Gynurincola endophyticus]|uniref:FecR family protein n=1 Tax=Gynurincola endophyticus TaxID=2479004 RepID=UPI000F8E4586|nr:FecR family protein [Gynurincola endophyticus]
MKNIESRINGIWNDRLTSEELRAFLRDFQQNENDWRISLYQDFQKNLEEQQSTPQEIAREAKIFASIQDRILTNKKIIDRQPAKRLIHLRVKWAVAAGILLLAGTWSFYQLNKQPTPIFQPELQIVQQQSTGEWQTNTSHKPKKIITTDSSVITLSPGSSIYVEMSSTTSRHILLKGKARFDVKKDKNRPFSVEANGIITTALGTIFSVDGETAAHKVNVQLFEGKVMVTASDKKKKIKELYLNAGEQCFINTAEEKAYVTLIPVKPITKPAIPDVKTIDIPVIEYEELSRSLDFDKTSLPNVFKRLEYIYSCTIAYKEEDVRGMLFTGTFATEDSLTQVLQVIANMNDLNIIQENGNYKIIKQHTSKETPSPILNEKNKDSSAGNQPVEVSYQTHLPYPNQALDSRFSSLYKNFILFNDYA